MHLEVIGIAHYGSYSKITVIISHFGAFRNFPRSKFSNILHTASRNSQIWRL